MKHPVVENAQMVLVFLGGKTLIGGLEVEPHVSGGDTRVLHYPFVLVEQIGMNPQTRQPSIQLTITKMLNIRPMIPNMELEGSMLIFELDEKVKEDVALVGGYEDAYKQARGAESGLTLAKSIPSAFQPPR